MFERLGLSLYDFLRKNSYKPFHLDILRAFGRQLLEAVAYLHDLTLIHTDLKPENILLQSSEYDKQTPPPGSRRVPASVTHERLVALLARDASLSNYCPS